MENGNAQKKTLRFCCVSKWLILKNGWYSNWMLKMVKSAIPFEVRSNKMGNLPWKGWVLPIATDPVNNIGWKRLELLHKQLIFQWQNIMRTENHKSCLSYHYIMYVCCIILCYIYIKLPQKHKLLFHFRQIAMTRWTLPLKFEKKGPRESPVGTFQGIPRPLKIIPGTTATIPPPDWTVPISRTKSRKQSPCGFQKHPSTLWLVQ